MKKDSFIAWVFLFPSIPIEAYRVVTLLTCSLATVLTSDNSNLTLIATESRIGATQSQCAKPKRKCWFRLHLKAAWQNKTFGNRSRAYLTQDGRSSPHFTFLALQFLSNIVSMLCIKFSATLIQAHQHPFRLLFFGSGAPGFLGRGIPHEPELS